MPSIIFSAAVVSANYSGKRCEDQWVVQQLFQQYIFLVLATVSVWQEQGDDGEQVQKRHQKAHQDAGAGQTDFAVGVQGDGETDVGDVAAKRSLAEDASSLRGITAYSSEQVAGNKNNGDCADRSNNEGAVEISTEICCTYFIEEQQRQADINCDRTFFCGAYWRSGFHEDGVVSALNAIKHFEERLSNGQLHLRRAS